MCWAAWQCYGNGLKATLAGKPRYEDVAFRKFLRRYQWRALWVGKTRALEEIYRQKERMLFHRSIELLPPQRPLRKVNFPLTAGNLCCGVARINNELRRVDQCLPIDFAVVSYDEDGIIGGNRWRID